MLPDVLPDAKGPAVTIDLSTWDFRSYYFPVLET